MYDIKYKHMHVPSTSALNALVLTDCLTWLLLPLQYINMFALLSVIVFSEVWIRTY